MAYDFAKLTADVKAALEAGHEAADAVDDGGSCNLDGVLLKIPHINEKAVVAALAEAGVRAEKGDYGIWGTGYIVNPTSGGQADKRAVASGAIHQHLKQAGHEVTRLYIMD